MRLPCSLSLNRKWLRVQQSKVCGSWATTVHKSSLCSLSLSLLATHLVYGTNALKNNGTLFPLSGHSYHIPITLCLTPALNYSYNMESSRVLFIMNRWLSPLPWVMGVGMESSLIIVDKMESSTSNWHNFCIHTLIKLIFMSFDASKCMQIIGWMQWNN